MSEQLPLNAEDIDLKWHIQEGGIGITASTDETGLPYIGLYLLNRMGDPISFPISLQHQHLMCRLVAGYIKRQPIIVFIDAEVTVSGLNVRFVPPAVIKQRGYKKHTFVAWGSEGPRYHLTVYPANSNQPDLMDNSHDALDDPHDHSTTMETGGTFFL